MKTVTYPSGGNNNPVAFKGQLYLTVVLVYAHCCDPCWRNRELSVKDLLNCASAGRSSPVYRAEVSAPRAFPAGAIIPRLRSTGRAAHNRVFSRIMHSLFGIYDDKKNHQGDACYYQCHGITPSCSAVSVSHLFSQIVQALVVLCLRDCAMRKKCLFSANWDLLSNHLIA